MKANKAVMAAVTVVVLVAAPAGAAGADFVLQGDQQLTVNDEYVYGYLFDSSHAAVVEGGSVSKLYAYNSSTVDISGGSAIRLHAYNTSTVDISSEDGSGWLYAHDGATINVLHGSVVGAGVGGIDANGDSVVNMTHGYTSGFHVHENSTVNVSDSRIKTFYAGGTSTVNIRDTFVGSLLGCGVHGALYARDDAEVNISGDCFVTAVRAGGNSVVNIAGGRFEGDGEGPYGVHVSGNSTVNITGGVVVVGLFGGGGLCTHDGSTTNISGGAVELLSVYDESTVTIRGRDFVLGDELSLDGDRVFGTGDLSGEWFDGTPWTVTITANDPGATILAIPEPATLGLLALGSLAVLRRRRRET